MTDVARVAEPPLEPAPLESVPGTGPHLSPGQLFWRQFRRSPIAIAGGSLLIVLYALALFAPFVAPYGEADQDRAHFFHPPMPLRWFDASGFHAIPFVRATRPVRPDASLYQDDPGHRLPLRFLVHGAPYRLFGVVRSDLHLFGTDPPGRIFLLGTDPNGRDVFSRLLFGSQISLTVGLVGIAISFSLGLILGGVSGYFGGWVDTVIMRFSELLLSIPTLYLLIALRQVVPNDLPSQQVYLGIIAILAFIGWAGFARIIRGMVLSIRRQEYVTAAEALGMGRMRIIARHILPNTMSFVIVAATVAIPGFILGEVVLSFIGLGVQEPAASWGNMLSQARSISVLTGEPWLLFAPGVAIFVTVMAFNFLGDGLRDALDPRKVMGGKSG
jgi:peptide/nickel transport system permease protein